MISYRRRAALGGAAVMLIATAALVVNRPVATAAQVPAAQVPPAQAPNQAPKPQAPTAPQSTDVAGSAEGTQEAPNELSVTVGKSLIVSTAQPIERISVGYGDVAEATAVSPREVLINGKAPGETSLIVWEQGGIKLFFDLLVRPNSFLSDMRVDSIRRQMKKEMPGESINVSFDNDTVFLRGIVKDLTSATRAVSIASTLGRTVNLLYINAPSPEAQILLKVKFASVDRSVSTQLGMNLVSTGAKRTIGSVSTGQYSPPSGSATGNGTAAITLSDALNIFLFRPDLNLGATIQALQTKGLIEVLAEPNVLAHNGRQASFLAGGEFPFPTLQGGGLGLGQVTIQFREFGVRINFLPMITPRGTIRLEVAPEVSSLDTANGLVLQGFTVPGISVRRVHTDIELESGQSFAIGGLLDNRLTETLDKIPLLGDIPLVGKIFRSKSLAKNNTELLVLITPEIVRPIPAGLPTPGVKYPKPFLEANTGQPMRTPGVETTGPVPTPPTEAIPVEQYIQSMKRPRMVVGQGMGGPQEPQFDQTQQQPSELQQPIPQTAPQPPPAAPPK